MFEPTTAKVEKDGAQTERAPSRKVTSDALCSYICELARDDGETGEQNERERAAYFFLRRIVFFALVAV